jgi:Raf kinase inhibitor-like YbhB/YbcL family protein
MNRMARAALVVAALASGGAAMSLELSSPAFTHGNPIPAKYTCEGEDTSPALAWRGVPAGTRSLVLIVDDPDAPDPAAPKMTWVHWVVLNLPPESAGLPEGAGSGAGLPSGAASGRNDWKRPGYGGPCPPIGRHRYFHKLYALDRTLSFTGQPTKKDVEAAMHGHVLATAELVGTYEKERR